MNYRIVKDEVAMKAFIDQVLPDLEANQKFFLSLFARKKYVPDLIKSSDSAQLARFTATKENMIYKIRQLEIAEGCYQMRRQNGENQAVPQQALALYINPNPRDMMKATHQMGTKCWKLIQNSNHNVHQEAMSCIQRSIGYKKYVDFDIDDKEIDTGWITRNLHAYHLILTHGGYHLLVDPKAETAWRKHRGLDKMWYTAVRQKFEVDNVGDQLLPIPGGTQGGSIPRLVLSSIPAL